MITISTHVLDTARGKPAAGVPAHLEARDGDAWKRVGGGTTNDDGRVRDFVPAGTELAPGTYRLTFDTAAYAASRGERGFYPYVQIVFEILPGGGHHHVPLLLSPYGYSTYRGS